MLFMHLDTHIKLHAKTTRVYNIAPHVPTLAKYVFCETGASIIKFVNFWQAAQVISLPQRGSLRRRLGVNTYASCAVISHQDFDNEAIFST